MDTAVALATRSPHRGRRLLTRYNDCRKDTLESISSLAEADMLVQSMPERRPVVWHLAHTSWFFEASVLERFSALHRPCSRYVPNLAGALGYRRAVDDSMASLLAGPVDSEIATMVELGMRHEEQDRERMLADLLNELTLRPCPPVVAHRVVNRRSLKQMRVRSGPPWATAPARLTPIQF